MLRLAREFLATEFMDNVCKSIRLDQMQTNDHSSSKWRACQIKARAVSARSIS